MVGANRSATGHPLFVAGPQIGYYYPGLTLEMDLKGPGIEARGAAIPGGAGTILIGRSQDTAWSLTSAGSDTNDQFVETLCGGSDQEVHVQGPLQEDGHGSAPARSAARPVVYNTTVHGPVQGYATSGGKKVAITFHRSSAGRDVLWELMFRGSPSGEVTGLKSFYAAAATSPFTFNVAYADDKNIATYSAGGCRSATSGSTRGCPRRAPGQFEWKGFLAPLAHPHVANPASRRARELEQQAGRRTSARPTTSGRTGRSSASRC